MKEISEKEFEEAKVREEANKKIDEKLNQVPKQEEKKEKEDVSQFTVKSTTGTIIVGIEEFIKFASIKKQIKIGEFEITLKTLTNKERVKAMKYVKVIPNMTLKEYEDECKIPLLAFSVVRVNELIFDNEENKAQLMVVLNDVQGIVIDTLWTEYNIIMEEQYELIGNEELKKKSLKIPSVDSIGQ